MLVAGDDESTRSRLGAHLSRRFGADYRLLCVELPVLSSPIGTVLVNPTDLELIEATLLPERR